MSITREEILHLAEMSSLTFADPEIENLRGDLDAALDDIAVLDELDLKDVKLTYQVIGEQNVWREDEIEKFEAGRDDLLALAAETRDNQIKVPKIL